MNLQKQALADRIHSAAVLNSVREVDLQERADKEKAASQVQERQRERAEDEDEDPDEAFEDEDGDALLGLCGMMPTSSGPTAKAKAGAAKGKAGAKAKAGAPLRASAVAAPRCAAAAASAGKQGAKLSSAPSTPPGKGEVVVPTSGGKAGRKAKSNEFMFNPEAYLDSDGLGVLKESLQEVWKALAEVS
jgi:hypothetical protein